MTPAPTINHMNVGLKKKKKINLLVKVVFYFTQLT